MGSGVTRRSHSRSAALAALLLLAGCLEPAPGFEARGTTPGAAKVEHCSPLNCTGCCAGDECLGGNTDDACGYDGRGCNTCPDSYRCQAPGACYPVPMEHVTIPEPIPNGATCVQVGAEIHCQ